MESHKSKQANKETTLLNTQNKLVVAREEVGRCVVGGEGIKREKLPVIK